MPQHRRTAAACLLLLLVALFGPAAPAATAATAPASVPTATSPDGAFTPPHIGVRDDGGGSCRPLDVPLKGADAVVAHGHTDPLTAAGTARSPLPRAPHQRLGVPRAPPGTVAGAAELLPVLRI
ncbi:hypothetical protein [Streptomyces caatingaensis]|uniref:Uncharacterized protein n=1 Tax=Streptomyces caatingaensis TaxID=1678637 RepID=A0A0K9X8H7_9ACTN|nr:hypothetical protein [Streptomyces caatingaensis]KNB49406.1 hypothetical protein AC230_29580 [Streptomyces caatingaensis]